MENYKKDHSNDEDDKKVKQKITESIILEKAVERSRIKMDNDYSRPRYNKVSRKKYYDNPKSHKDAIDLAFKDGKVYDPYTGRKLFKKQHDAKLNYGSEWQNYAAEADHIYPLNKIDKKIRNNNFYNSFITTENQKEISNIAENYQIISRSSNQSSEMGKGGKTQLEWANDANAMEKLSDNSAIEESSSTIKNRIINKDMEAEEAINRNLKKISLKNMRYEANKAGLEGAKYSGGAVAIISLSNNFSDVINGRKDAEDAIKDIAKDTGKASVLGYCTNASLSTLSHMLSNNSSKLLNLLAEKNIPAKVISSITIIGDSIKKWSNGEITTEECLLEIGEKGINTMLSGYAAIAGQALIPIPVVGATIGALVGSTLTQSYIGNILVRLEQSQLEHEERMRIIEECNILEEKYRRYNEELKIYIDKYFNEMEKYFDDALMSIKFGIEFDDSDGIIYGANKIASAFGSDIKYETVDEFIQFIESNEIDSF